MERIRQIFTRIHIGWWVILSAFLCWVLYSEGQENWLLTASGLSLASLTVFYSHFFILGNLLGKGRKLSYVLGLLLIFFIGPFVYIWLDLREIHDLESFIDQYVTTMFSFVLVFVIFSALARVTESWFVNAFKKESLEKQAIRSELAYLKAQINPHFLFNTLNNIHALSYKQSPEAPEAIMQLSALMRYMLYESNADTVALSREVEYLQNYIALQQLRMRTENVVRMDIQGDISHCQVAPLLFIHLLENAFKHSPFELKPGDITIDINVANDTLLFSISNPAGQNKRIVVAEEGGIGLPNIKKRLELLYSDRHTLDIENDGTIFRATLRIKNPGRNKWTQK